MTEERKSKEEHKGDLAPELYNDEQEDEAGQAHEIAREAHYKDAETSPLDSTKVKSGIDDNSAEDIVDRMRDMEQSGRVDMDAYLGEPNLDDDEDKYGEDNRIDDLPA